MSYDAVIHKYRDIHRQTDVEALNGHWHKSRGKLNVYVHSPFCASLCRFCYYKGTLFDTSSHDDYKKYYYEYLPRSVEPFLLILESHSIGNYFFGGGTPSLMDAQTMADVFDLFPGFRNVSSKTFEVHPAIWSDDQLDVLINYRFNCCIVGIQSFDQNVLLRQRRTPASVTQIKSLAASIKLRGMYLAIDLIYRMDPIDADEIFCRDLDIAAELNADVISLQHNYDEIGDESHIERFFDLIANSPLKDAYYWEQSAMGDSWMTVEKKKSKKCFRLVNKSLPLKIYREQVFPFVNSIDECSKTAWQDADYPSAIGFGSLRNARKNTFSSIRGHEFAVEYIEVNNNWRPEYFITYHSDKRLIFSQTIDLMERYKLAGSEPEGLSCAIVNGAQVNNDRFITRRAENLVALQLSWTKKTTEVEKFLVKLQAIFPNMQEQGSVALLIDSPR